MDYICCLETKLLFGFWITFAVVMVGIWIPDSDIPLLDSMTSITGIGPEVPAEVLPLCAEGCGDPGHSIVFETCMPSVTAML